MSKSGIIVVGSLKPGAKYQDRVRVLGTDGVCQALRASDSNEPPKILGTVYTDVSEDFQRGIFPIARCVKASKHDLRIIELQSELKKEIGSGPMCIERTYCVRHLTPLECWRLMGFSEDDFRKAESVNSNTQLYKQAGNSIVKDVLIAVFGQMIPGREAAYCIQNNSDKEG